jgi:hypothetical protein
MADLGILVSFLVLGTANADSNNSKKRFQTRVLF